MGGPTVKEVAQAAGVSVATVSRSLQLPDLVAPDTRQRVEEAILRLGYAPNAQARTLRTSKTRLIVALVPDITNPFFSGVIRGIEKEAHANGYSVLLGDTQYEPGREEKYARMITERQADGLITLLPRMPKIRLPGRAPVVNACEYIVDPEVTSVYVDNRKAAHGATQYLIALGHRRIACLAGRQGSPLSIDRLAGYKAALTEARIGVNNKLISLGDFSIESGGRAVDALFARREAFTAVFCASDEMAIGAMQAIRSRGLRVPEDISVIGFDDIHVSRYLDPPLTTVAQPQIEIGREAMTLLLGILNGVDVPPQKRILPTELVLRGSTAPPAAEFSE